MNITLWLWILFNAFVLAMLALDLGVFHRRAHAVTRKEALLWSVFWIVLSLLFCAGVWHWQGGEKGLEFLAGYVIEKSLSLDNIFVFLMVFSYFRVPAEFQHRVLYWGILGALVMRGGMIAAGVALLNTFDWVIFVFGGFLVVTGIRFATHGEVSVHPERNPLLKFLRRFLPVTGDFEKERLVVRKENGWHATPLFVVLLVIESSDVVFAVDSIPAIFAVTRDPFIVYSSNVFAILGLRALYFLLATVMTKFRYLNVGLGIILSFVGVKMLMSELYHIPVPVSLVVIAAVLAVTLGFSIWRSRGEER